MTSHVNYPRFAPGGNRTTLADMYRYQLPGWVGVLMLCVPIVLLLGTVIAKLASDYIEHRMIKIGDKVIYRRPIRIHAAEAVPQAMQAQPQVAAPAAPQLQEDHVEEAEEEGDILL